MHANDTDLSRTRRQRTDSARSRRATRGQPVRFRVQRIGPPPAGALAPSGSLALTIEYLSEHPGSAAGQRALYIVPQSWYRPFANAVGAAIAARRPYWVWWDRTPQPACMVGVDDAVAVRLLHAIRDGQVVEHRASSGQGDA